MKKKTISIVFSLRNEENNLHELLKRLDLHTLIESYSIELIFIDDDSTDKSLEILKQLRDNYSKLKNIKFRIFHTFRRFGVTECLLYGIHKSQGDGLIYMDSDLQDPPELIKELLNKWEDGYEIVHTQRLRRKGETFLKKILSNLAYKFIHFFSEYNIPKDCGDFKLIDKKVVDFIKNQNEKHPYIKGLIPWGGYKSTFVLYVREKRNSGESGYQLHKSLNPYRELMKGMLLYSNKIAPISLLVNLAFMIISLFAIIYLILSKDLSLVNIIFILGFIIINFHLTVIVFYIFNLKEDASKRPVIEAIEI